MYKIVKISIEMQFFQNRTNENSICDWSIIMCFNIICCFFSRKRSNIVFLLIFLRNWLNIDSIMNILILQKLTFDRKKNIKIFRFFVYYIILCNFETKSKKKMNIIMWSNKNEKILKNKILQIDQIENVSYRNINRMNFTMKTTTTKTQHFFSTKFR